MLRNTITAAGIVKDLSDAELLDVASEVREWQKTGETMGVHLSLLSGNLICDAGLSEGDIAQAAESLVLREVCDRWVAVQNLKHVSNANVQD